MGFITNLLNLFKDDEKEDNGIVNVKQVNLNYNSKLISMLESDHRKLFELYGELMETFHSNNDFKNVNGKLIEFKMALEIHLMVEDTQLYGYLGQKYSDNQMVIGFIKDVQNEMKLIAETAILFIRKYADIRMFNENKDNFVVSTNDSTVSSGLIKNNSIDWLKT